MKGIVIVEIPHQRPASSWVADNWPDAARRANTTYSRADLVRAEISNDLHACYFFTTAKDLRWFLENYTGHQKFEAIRVARESGELLDWG
jgi:hypothetical protein